MTREDDRMGRLTPFQRGTPAHALSPAAVRLLSACCAEPQSQAEIEAVLWRRGFPVALSEQGLRHQLRALVEAGYLWRHGPGVRGHPFRYALTPAGEDALEALWR